MKQMEGIEGETRYATVHCERINEIGRHKSSIHLKVGFEQFLIRKATVGYTPEKRHMGFGPYILNGRGESV